MNTKRIKRAANFFFFMFFVALIYSIIQAVALIKTQQFTFLTFIGYVVIIIPNIIMWGFADATADALDKKAVTKEESEVLKHYTDGRN